MNTKLKDQINAECDHAAEDASRGIPAGQVVHHKDGNKLNNTLANLELMEWGEHSALHNHAKRGVRIKPETFCHCGNTARARGLCTKHYQQLMKLKRGYWP